MALFFKPIEFDRFKAEAGDNALTLMPQQWIKATDAIGIFIFKFKQNNLSQEHNWPEIG
jgi:hypothetical protein